MHSFHIYRYDPDLHDAPRMQVIDLEVNPGDRMLLDVLMRLKAIDPSLSLLLIGVPELRVEPRQVRRSRRPASGLPLPG